MTDEPNEEKTDDEVFGEFLDKVGPTWLENQLKKLAEKNPPQQTGTEPKTAGGLEAFLTGRLEKAEDEGRNLREALAEALDYLTPEQRLTLRKRPRASAVPDDPEIPNTRPKKKPNETNSEQKPKGLMGVLKRL